MPVMKLLIARSTTAGGRRQDRGQISYPHPQPSRKAAKRVRGVRVYTDADLDRVIEAIKARPGALPSAFQKASGLKENVFKAAVFKIKQDGLIKVLGKARNTSCTVA